MRAIAVLCLVAAAFIGCLSVAQAQDCDLLVGYFSQSTTLYQAQQQGFFGRTGINICSAPVQGSVEAYEGLQVGRYEVLQSATDNGFSRYFLPSAYPGQNVTLMGQIDGSSLQIIGARGDIATIEDLRGKTILVDSPVSGLIFNLRRVLAIHNLYYPRDYDMVQYGANRFPILQQGYLTVNGVNVSVHAAVIAPPQSTQMIVNPNIYLPNVKNLGVIADDIEPVAGTSLQTDPNHILDPVKSANIDKFMAAMLMARAFVMNPANAATVTAGIATLQNLGQQESAVTYTAVSNPLVGEQIIDFSFQRLAFGNSAFLKAIFDDRYNNSNYAQELFNPGFGRLIDYGPRDRGQVIANQLSAVTINNPYTNVCVFPANSGYNYVIENAVANLHATGGCLGTHVAFKSCSSSDEFAAPVDCKYNATSDRLTISTTLAASQASRSYTVKYTVTDDCIFSQTVSQVVTVRAANSGSCVDVRPSCTLDVSSSTVSTWSSGSVTTGQYNLAVHNPSHTTASSVVFQLSSSDAARLQSVWNLQSIGSNKYVLPSWANTIASGATYTQAGYISNSGPVTFSPVSVSCA